jgi:DNA-binding transcriptional ArsR family regulator
MQDTQRAYKASVFQALAHPTRIAIIEVLRSGELSTRVIQERLGIEQANLSQHLAILRSRQLVLNRKDGNRRFSSLGRARDRVPPGLGRAGLLAHLTNHRYAPKLRMGSSLNDSHEDVYL